jgi:DNA-binding NarL/FixJ family response regulator
LRIFLADMHSVLRRGLRHLLTQRPGWLVCGETQNGKDAVALVLELRPDVVILEHELAEINGVEATRLIKEALPETEILFFTTREEDYFIAEALRAGASGYILKADDENKLIKAVEMLGRHLPFLNTRASEMLLHHLSNGSPNSADSRLLTQREREIVKLLTAGNPNKEAASQLGISMKTVEAHRSAIMRKLELKSIAQLVLYAIRNGIVQP